jgi:hypothetical protein
MANEFIIKNGFRSQGNSEITGSLNVTSGITGSLFGTSSWAISSSHALTASYALNAGAGNTFPYTGSAQITGSLGVTGSVTITDGRVGIGTVNPDTDYILHVSSGYNAIRLDRVDDKPSFIRYTNINGTMFAGVDSTGSFTIDSNLNKFGGKPDFVIDQQTGWVGLGSASVQAQLHINYGNFGFESFQPAFLVNTSATDTDIFVVDYLRQVGIGKYPTGSKLDISGSTKLTGSLSVSGSVSFTTIPNSSTSNVLYYDTTTGNVSYGTPGAGSADTGSLLKTASFSDPNITFEKGDGSTFTVDISGLNAPIASYSTLTASILSGTTVTIPGALTYYSSSTYEYLEVHANGLQLRYNIDFIPITTASVQFNITIPSGSELVYKSYKRP